MQRRILAVLVSAAAFLAPAGSAAASSGEHGHGGTRTTAPAPISHSATRSRPATSRVVATIAPVGYVGRVLAGLDTRHHPTQLVNLACSGETAASMVAGGHCDIYPTGSQLDEAVAYLEAHPGRTSVITVDIGANDVQRCLAGGSIDVACIQAGMAAVHDNLRRHLRPAPRRGAAGEDRRAQLLRPVPRRLAPRPDRPGPRHELARPRRPAQHRDQAGRQARPGRARGRRQGVPLAHVAHGDRPDLRLGAEERPARLHLDVDVRRSATSTPTTAGMPSSRPRSWPASTATTARPRP